MGSEVSTVGLGSGVLLLEGVSVGRRSLFLLDEVDRSEMRARACETIYAGRALGDRRRRSVCVIKSRAVEEEERRDGELGRRRFTTVPRPVSCAMKEEGPMVGGRDVVNPAALRRCRRGGGETDGGYYQ
jgi:hypothetical protein